MHEEYVIYLFYAHTRLYSRSQRFRISARRHALRNGGKPAFDSLGEARSIFLHSPLPNRPSPAPSPAPAPAPALTSSHSRYARASLTQRGAFRLLRAAVSIHIIFPADRLQRSRESTSSTISPLPFAIAVPFLSLRRACISTSPDLPPPSLPPSLPPSHPPSLPLA